jgi:hypothetical protein
MNIWNSTGRSTSVSSWYYTASQDVWHATTTAKSIYDYNYITCCWSNWSTHGRAFQNWSQSNSKAHTRVLSDLARDSSRQPGNHPSGIHMKNLDKWFSFFKYKMRERERALCWNWGLLSVFACSQSLVVLLVISFLFFQLLSFSFYSIFTSICSFIAGAVSYVFCKVISTTICCLFLWCFFVQPATSDFIVRDTGNCSPRYMKCTINQVIFNFCDIFLALNKFMRNAKISCLYHLFVWSSYCGFFVVVT